MLVFDSMVPGSATRLLSVEECRPEIQELYRLWCDLRGTRAMPARADFNPSRARRLLPHLLLVDVDPDAPRLRRFRIRLHGTAQVEYQGIDWTGAYLHDRAGPEAAERLCDVGDHIVSAREPWVSTGGLYWLPEKPYSRFEAILLPLSDDDQTVNMILGLTIFF